MLSLLTVLLLAGPPSVRADDPAPDAQTQTLDPADTDGDGVVSGKERRKARRAARRARRAANGQTMTDEEADAADADAAASAGDAASSKAAGAAAAFKNSLPSADAGGGIGGAGGPGGAGAGGPGSPGGGTTGGDGKSAASGNFAPASGAALGGKPGGAFSGASGNPARPKAPGDFVLAAHSGYAPAFAKAGLKLAPDGRTVLRLDGKPATADDYARLQHEISQMPEALGRRPDFFSAVSPEHYSDLKQGYKNKKDGDPVYKDVGTTEGDRDFVHTASCDKLSGDCNKSAQKDSYKKGDFVAPEDLDKMWSALQKELDGSAAAEDNKSGEMPSLSGARTGLASEKAAEAARALTGETSGGGASPVVASGAAAKVSAPIVAAVASVRRLWKSATVLAFSGGDGTKEAGPSRLLVIIGAASLAALGAGVLFLRRKG